MYLLRVLEGAWSLSAGVPAEREQVTLLLFSQHVVYTTLLEFTASPP